MSVEPEADAMAELLAIADRLPARIAELLALQTEQVELLRRRLEAAERFIPFESYRAYREYRVANGLPADGPRRPPRVRPR